MKRVLSFLCAVAMILTMCTFYMGEALSVAATEETPAGTVVEVSSYSEFKAALTAAEAGTTIKFTDDIVVSEWTFKAADAEKVTLTNGTEDAEISIKDDETFGTVINGATVTNSTFGLTLADGVNIDGNGKSIKGFVVVGTPSSSVYFFSRISENSTVCDVTFEDCAVIVNGTNGNVALLTNALYGKVIDCKIAETVAIGLRYTGTGTVKVAGITVDALGTGTEVVPKTLEEVYEQIQNGQDQVKSESLIDGCVNEADIIVYNHNTKENETASYQRTTYVSGIASRTKSSVMRNCANYGDITASGFNMYGVAGIVGVADMDSENGKPLTLKRNTTIYNCANYGAVTTSGATHDNVGGIVGYISCYNAPGGQFNLANCYNTGAISLNGADGAEFGMIGTAGNNSGSTTIDGYKYKAILHGGTALNFNNTATAPNLFGKTNHDVKVTYNADMTNLSLVGSFSITDIFSAPGNVYEAGVLGKKNVWEILKETSKYFEGARPWTNGANGPEIDFASSNEPLTISSVSELNAYRDMFNNYCEQLGSKMVLKATLANDIDLNKGVTFGFDAEKKAAVITTGDATYYLGYGATGGLAAGTFFDSNLAETTAPALNAWTSFASAASPTQTYRGHSDKVSLWLDGNGYAIKGLYINKTSSGSVGFASMVSNVRFENLTLDGLIYHATSSFREGTGAFIGTAFTDCSVVDCVNNVNVLMHSSTNANIGGIVGHLGFLATNSDTSASAHVFERMPNRISEVIGCVNNGTVAAVSTNNCLKIAGVVGLTTSGEVSYCTNTGNVYAPGSSEIVAGVAIATPSHVYGNYTIPANVAAGSSIAAGSKTLTPYQSTVRFIGNSNSGTISYGTVTIWPYGAGTVYVDARTASHGAWMISGSEGKVGPKAVLPSEITVKNNVGTYVADRIVYVKVEGTNETHALEWTDGPSLKVVAGNGLTNESNKYIAAGATAATLNNALYAVKTNGNGYGMFFDYDYSNKGVPHAIKLPEGFGYTLSNAGALTEITIGSAEALMLLNDIVNSVTENKSVAIGSGVANNTIEAFTIGFNSQKIAADGTETLASNSINSSTANAVAYYLKQARNGAPDLNTSLSGVTVKLTANIDLGGAEWLPLGNAAYAYDNAISAGYGFAGTFDGGGHTVSNISFPEGRTKYVGFFGSILDGTLKNVKFSKVNANITSDGAIAACFARGTVSNVIVDETCSIQASTGFAGGVVCYAVSATTKITDCVNKASVTVGKKGAGVVSKLYSATVSKCVNYGDITSTSGGYIGGIVMVTEGGAQIIQNTNHGAIGNETATTTLTYIGGIVAHLVGNNSKVEGNVNRGAIKGYHFIGGIAGVVGYSSGVNHNQQVKGNVNYGTITRGNHTRGSGGIVGYVMNVGSGNSSKSQREVTYNVNFGSVQYGWAIGGIVGEQGDNNKILGTSIYGNIDATGKGIAGFGTEIYSVLTNNYIVGQGGNGQTTPRTLIDGENVTLNQFRLGYVANIINNLSYNVNNFLSTSEEYIWAEGGDEISKNYANATYAIAANYTAPLGLESNYMVQRIGVDEYPLPKLAAEIIYAAEEGVTDAAAEVIAATASVAKGKIYESGATPSATITGNEQLVGFINDKAQLVAPGKALEAKNYLYPLTIDFYTAYGAAARTKTPTGIRYQTYVNEDSVDLLEKIMGKEAGTLAENFGTIVIPYSYTEAYINRDSVLTAQTIMTDTNTEVNIQNDKWAPEKYSKNGYYTYFGSLVNIMEDHYSWKYSGISYLHVEYADGSEAYITAPWQTASGGSEFADEYSYDVNARSIEQIAFRALNDPEFTPSEAVRKALEAYCGSYTE